MANDVKLEAQVELLGCMLIDDQLIGPILGAIPAEDFYTPEYRTIYETIQAQFFAGQAVSPVTVVDGLKGKGNTDWYDLVRQCMALTPSTTKWEADVEVLKGEGVLRKYQSSGLALAGAKSLDEAEQITGRINALGVRQGRVKIVSAAEAAVAFLNRIDPGAPAPEYMGLGIQQLDEVLTIEAGDMVVLGGYPSAGKTLLSLQFAKVLASKYRVGYFSLETGERKLTDRIMSQLSKVPLGRIKHKELLTKTELEALQAAAMEFAGWPFEIIESSGSWSVRDVQSVALSRRYQVIIVDYMQLLSAQGGTETERVANASRNIKSLCRDHGITVLALAQLSRPDKVNGKPVPPRLTDLRQSGQIEQDADVVLLLWPSDPNDNNSRRVLKVAKNKEGPRASMELDFDGSIQTLIPPPPEIHQTTFEELGDAGPDEPF